MVEGECVEDINSGVSSFPANGEKIGVLEGEVGVTDLGRGSCLEQVRELNGDGSGSEEEKFEGLRGSDEVGLGANSAKGKKRRLSMDLNLFGSDCALEDGESKVYLNLRSGKRVAKRGMGSVGSSVGGDEFIGQTEVKKVEKGEDNEELGRGPVSVENSSVKHGRRFTREVRGKGKLVRDDLASNGVSISDNLANNDGSESADERQSSGGDENGNAKLGGAGDGGVVIDNGPVQGTRRFGRKEKGKGVVVDSSLLRNSDEKTELDLDSDEKNLVENAILGLLDLSDDATLSDETNVLKAKARENESRRRESARSIRESTRRGYMVRFREIARENATRFALFSPQEEEENHLSSGAEEEQEFEDWPGPFSTAMKIIKDRTTKNRRREGSLLEKSKHAPLIWVPRRIHNHSKRLVPSLKELSLGILAKNADAIVSLENVPDTLKHKLSQLLCDSRRMNSHFFELLIQGSPTEVRLRDCSWLTEEQFTKCFQGCNTSNLMVLQLDQCGRCMPDYILLSTLARSPNSLPALTTLSLSGACRLSDVGLTALASSSPALRSLNLSQCSLLTSSSIGVLADALGPVLRELHLTDCQSIYALLILPALKKFEQLEILSVAGIQDVCDDFLREFITARGHNMKELVLTDCVKLTDSSLKVIAETCPGLCAIDLGNLCKLTDSALAYLANGCRAIRTLKLCRNAFSDEAIAAFLETSGEWLEELSLNNVRKVGHNTAMSLARRSRRLRTLDLSWCRNLTDEAMGVIVDSCLSLRVLKLFGCTQITNFFLDGHSNPDVQIIGLKMSAVLEHVRMLDHQEGPLRYSSVSSAI